MSPVWVCLMCALFVLWIAARQRQNYHLLRLQKKKKGRTRTMPKELIQEFIGKRCSVSTLGESFGAAGRITSVEENWIRFEPEGKGRSPMLLNGDMIVQIKLLPEKNK